MAEIKSLLLKTLIEEWKPYFQIENVTEIIVNEAKEIIIEKNGRFEFLYNEKINEQFLLDFCEQLANYRNMFFNVNVPHLSSSIPNTNIRVQALHPSITRNNNISLVMRIPNEKIFQITDFKLGNKLIEKNINYENIKNIIINKKNLLVSGGTGSGKTSFINSLIQLVPKEERIITIEDSSELKIENKNQTNILISKNDQNTYSYQDGMNDAMRMRPDRVFVGEIDTRNTMLFLRLSNTGHTGMISTIHANGVEEAIEAITLNAKFDGNDISVNDLKEYFINAIDFVIQITKINNERVISDFLDVKKTFKENKNDKRN